MSSRHRNRSVLLGSGVAEWQDVGEVSPVNRSLLVSETCDDVVGNFEGANPLSIDRSWTGAFILEGYSRPSNSFCWRFSSFPCLSGGGGFTAPLYAEPSANALLSAGLARSNPNRPDVDLPVFFFELKDIPRMVKEYGRQIIVKQGKHHFRPGQALKDAPRSIGKHYLEWQFAVLPFFNDVAKILNFQAVIDKRIRQLKSFEDGVATRHATVYQDTSEEANWSSAYLTDLYFDFNRVRWRMRTDRKTWVSTRWITSVPLPSTDFELRRLANRLAYGNDISLSTLWEALPWSWLVDWFSNIGDIVASTRNAMPVTHTGSCIMRHTTKAFAAWEWETDLSGGRMSLKPVPILRETKTRVEAPFVVFPEFSLPLLTGGQLSILSALTAVKGSRL